jgi:hypothetical protein
MTEFEGWLEKGLGRAAVFLKTNASRPWREQLLYACTHDLTYDRQCEDSRARYLLDLIEISGDTDFYRERIIESLGSDDEELDLSQLFELAASFAANGSVVAKQAMYAAFDRRGFSDAGLTCAEQLVILDGLRGLLSVAKSFSEVEADERPWQFGALIEALEKIMGSRRFPRNWTASFSNGKSMRRSGSRNDRKGQVPARPTRRSSRKSWRRGAGPA